MAVEALARVLNGCTEKGTLKLVLIGIANHAGDGGSWPSINTLARYASVTPRNAQKAVHALAEAGWITIHEQKGGTTRTPNYARPNLYEIRWERFVAPDTPPPSGATPGPPVGGDTPPPTGATPEPSLEPATTEPSSKRASGNAEPGALALVEADDRRPSAIPPKLWAKLPEIVRASGHAEHAWELCQRLAASLTERGHRAEISRRWLVDMEAMIRIDGRDPAHVAKVIGWLHEGPDRIAGFWRPNIQSPESLRAQWVRMGEQYVEERTKANRPRPGTAAAVIGAANTRAALADGETPASAAVASWTPSTPSASSDIMSPEVTRR